MIEVFAAAMAAYSGAAVPKAPPRELFSQADRCGLVFNVDAYPPGQGVTLSKDGRTVFLSTIRSRRSIRCVETWARSHGFKVRYGRF
jgi:hypothetical protein